MGKQLTIGDNYGPIFGVTTDRGQMIYLGGISFKLINSKGQERIEDSQANYDRAMTYVNNTVHMGRI